MAQTYYPIESSAHGLGVEVVGRNKRSERFGDLAKGQYEDQPRRKTKHAPRQDRTGDLRIARAEHSHSLL